MGGLQGLLNGNATAGADGTANQSTGSQSAGEASADAATTARVTSAVQQGASFLGPIGAGLAAGLGAITTVGAAGTSMFTDLTNQAGVGHNTYQPDYQGGTGDPAARANREANATDDQPADPGPAPTGSGESPAPDPLGGPPADYGATAGAWQQYPAAPSGVGGPAGAGGAGVEAAEVAVVAL
jgi:hypothetical protein